MTRGLVVLAVLAGGLLACGRVTAQNRPLAVTDFRVEPAAPVTMDEVTVTFTLRNTGREPVRIGQKNGVFVGARFVESLTRREHRDFGYQSEGKTLSPGEALSYRDVVSVDSAGEWRFWPVVEIGGEYVAFDEQSKTVVVKKRPPSSAVGKVLGPGKTIVYHQGQAITLQVLPPDNPWNRDVSGLPVHPMSDQWLGNIGRGTSLHPDFGSGTWEGGPIGIPYAVVRTGQPARPVDFENRDESDSGPYPIPPDVPVEGGRGSDGDRHVIVLDVDAMKLFELWRAFPKGDGWRAGSGAIFDLTSNKLRPEGWTSADAAGLPIFPGLVRYEEVYELGEISHALRFTAEKTQKGFLPPATHHASDVSTDLRPPLGMRVRLKASFDVSPFPERTQVILRALKKYGMFLADNGGDWFISGTPHPGWRDADIAPLRRIKGAQFEVVDTGEKVRHTEAP
jgi:hypothetical protein